MSNNLNRKSLYVTGFDKDIDRRTLVNEFSKFGDIKKLYLDRSGEFAQIYFVNRQSADIAVNAFENSILNWQVTFDRFLQNSNKTDNMSHFNDDYEDEDFSENFDYCNIHGQPLVVLQADSGDLYVNLKDVKRTGFALFRRDNFDFVLVDNRQIGKEFELHLLSEAKNYILKNRVASIDEDQILKTIERCKNKLLGTNSNNGPDRSVSQSSRNITVTSNVQQSEVSHPVMPESVQQRLPKTLPNNFFPTQTQRGDRSKGPGNQSPQQSNRGKRDNSRYNGVKGSNSGAATEDSLNSSSSSEPRDGGRKFGGFDGANKAQRNFKEKRDDFPRVNFDVKGTYDVTVSYKEEKENICWVQDKRYARELEEVIIKVNEVAEELEAVEPVSGQFVIAQYEGMWNRGRVFSTEPLTVRFIDYGNKDPVTLIKPLPDSLKTIPVLANRIAIDLNNSSSVTVKEDMDLKIFVKQKYEKGTYVVSLLDNNSRKENSSSKSDERASSVPKKQPDVLVEKPLVEEPPEVPKPKSYHVVPKPLANLRDGDMVMLVDVDDNKFLVKTKECALKSKSITDHIKALDKTAVTNVEIGQLVLSSKDGYVDLFRAVVVAKRDNTTATVKYVDFPGEADLLVKSLRNVDDFLAAEPATILVTQEYKWLGDTNEKGLDYILDICQKKEKLKVVLSKEGLDLQATDGSLLSQTLEKFKMQMPKLVPVETPKAKPSSSKEPPKTEEAKPVVAATDSKVLYDEMDWIKIDPGSYSLMCYCLQDIDDITFLSSTDDVIGYLETITSVNPTDQTPYKPNASEMCLVLYKSPDEDEATWYRAVVLSAEDDDYLINFVDFGNIESTTSENIRRFPTYLKDIPILGIGCECTGLPKKPEIVDRLKELIPEGTQVDVVVKELAGLKYQIEMPEIYKQLKAEKLF